MLLYNLSIQAYYRAIFIASFFNKKANLWIAGRRGGLMAIEQQLQAGEQRVWFHCASLGEFEQGRPLIEAIRQRYPQYKIVLTFFSPSGYEVRKNYAGADYVFYLPIDTAENARHFVQLVNPAMAFFVKYEFWYHYLQQLAVNTIPVYSVSAIFRPNQLFFKWYGSFYRKTLGFITHFFVQNEESKQLLASIGIETAAISGDTRFDRVWALSEQAQEIPIVKSFVGNEKVIVAGSTWPQDEEFLLPTFSKLLTESNYKLKLIIAPHEISETPIQQLQKYFGDRAIRYSSASTVDLSAYSVLIIDNIGLLSALYRYATVAYIGGGFGKGIHNVLEAATYAVPVVFGPNYSKFQEAIDLVKQGGAYAVQDEDVFNTICTELLNNETVHKHAATICGEYVALGKGATARIMEKISLP